MSGVRGPKRKNSAKGASSESKSIQEMQAMTNSLVEPLGYVVQNVAGDGDCLYSAIAVCLSTKSGVDIQKETVKLEILDAIDACAQNEIVRAYDAYQQGGEIFAAFLSNHILFAQIMSAVSLIEQITELRIGDVQDLQECVRKYIRYKTNNDSPYKWGDNLEVVTAAHLYGKLNVIAWQYGGNRFLNAEYKRTDPIMNGLVGLQNRAHLERVDDWSGIFLVLYDNHYQAIIPVGDRNPDHTIVGTINLPRSLALRF